jgi:nucleoside-diphosphate-sugar epimerase
MNILITGIHGFVGSNLVDHLKSCHKIYGLDIVSPEKEGIIKTFSWDDIDDTESRLIASLPDIDVIIHLAGKAHDTKKQSDEKVYFDINLGLTKKIFDCFLQSTATKFIFFSSVKAAADSVDGDILTEDVIPQPIGPYGESKIAAENYINFQFSTFNFQLKKVYIFRPCMIHGPGNKGNLNLLYNIVNKGLPWPLGAFENKRSFLNIWNLSYIVEQFITQTPLSGIYHLADDEPLSTNELITLIAASKNKKAKILKINKQLIQTLARLGDKLHLPLNSERLRKLTENYIVSNEKMKTALHIKNLPVDVRAGLQKTLHSLSSF